MLIDRGASHMLVNKEGRNALHAAVQNNKIKVVEYLISMNFPLNIRVKDGVTAVAIAAQNGNIDIVKLLVETGVNINKLSTSGVGPLYYAIQNGHDEIAKYLVEKGANIMLSSKYRDMSPFFLISSITDTKKSENPEQYAANMKIYKNMIDLIKSMKNLDQEDDGGFTIFSRYVLKESFEICQKLLDNG